jgi:Anti-sigma factor NepR
MQTDAHIHKVGGRLSREDQRRLGDILQRVYDDVVRQGVPDRFKDLLNELDDHAGEDEPTKAHGGPEGDDRRDHLVKAFPHNKGSN